MTFSWSLDQVGKTAEAQGCYSNGLVKWGGMDEISRKRTLMREFLETQGMSAASFTDAMIDDILSDRRTVDDVLDQFHSDDLKAKIKKHPKELLIDIPDFIKQKLYTDERISSSEREEFKKFLTSRRGELEKGLKTTPPNPDEIRRQFAEGKLNIAPMLARHRVWRRIFLSVTGLSAAIIGVASVMEATHGQEEYFIFAVVSGFILLSILNLLKFDKILFGSVDQLMLEIGKSANIEAVDRTIIKQKLDHHSITHSLNTSKAEDFTAFFNEVYDAIATSILRKSKDAIDQVATESAQMKASLQDAEERAHIAMRDMHQFKMQVEALERDKENVARVARQRGLAELSEVDTSSYLLNLLVEKKFKDRDAARKIVDAAIDCFPTMKDEVQALAHASEEHKRVAQYETILQLYNQKIAKLRAQDMDEEDKEEAIQAMKRLRDREIELLASAEVVNG